jgi:hypothetical protein
MFHGVLVYEATRIKLNPQVMPTAEEVKKSRPLAIRHESCLGGHECSQLDGLW